MVGPAPRQEVVDDAQPRLGHPCVIGVERRRGDEGGWLTRERDRAAGPAEVQRLHPHPVPREHQPLSLAIPQREREHPVEPGDGVDAPSGVGGEHDLGVRSGRDLLAEVT
jgi:hypothetical protein